MLYQTHPSYKILVLVDTMPWGHRSIARAINSYLRSIALGNNWQVDLVEVESNVDSVNGAYALATRYFPQINSLLHKLSQLKAYAKIVRGTWSQHASDTQAIVKQYAPDLIISTYYVQTDILAQWKMSGAVQFNLWTIVSDPWTPSPMTYFLKGTDLHLVYDEIAEKVGLKLGLLSSQILKTGWWVREEMYKNYNRSEIKRSLGIVDERPVLFVGGGSLGNNALPHILPLLLAAKRPICVIINTAVDQLAHSLVAKTITEYQRSSAEQLVQIINLGWIENMPEILAACDIVFGKAGPNFLMDVVASRKPFVAITHVAGNESGNLDLIRDHGLGWVKEKRKELEEFIGAYLDQPETYHRMFSDSIAREAERNRQSLPIIAERIKQIQGEPPVPS